MLTEPASGFCSPMMIFNKTLLPVPLRPSTASVSPRATVRSIPFRTTWAPKDLHSPRRTTGGSPFVFSRFSISTLLPIPFSAPLRIPKSSPLWKEHDDQFHHDDVGQDYKQRR